MEKKPNPVLALLGYLFRENPLVGIALVVILLGAAYLIGFDNLMAFLGAA